MIDHEKYELSDVYYDAGKGGGIWGLITQRKNNNIWNDWLKVKSLAKKNKKIPILRWREGRMPVIMLCSQMIGGYQLRATVIDGDSFIFVFKVE